MKLSMTETSVLLSLLDEYFIPIHQPITRSEPMQRLVYETGHDLYDRLLKKYEKYLKRSEGKSVKLSNREAAFVVIFLNNVSIYTLDSLQLAIREKLLFNA